VTVHEVSPHQQHASHPSLSPNDNRRTSSVHGSHGPLLSSPATISGQLPSNAQNSVETPYAVSEEDAHVQTLHRMTDGSNSTATGAGISDEAYYHEIFEYFGKLNSISILGEALGRRQRRRLIQLHISGSEYAFARQREISALDPVDKAYLDARKVFVLPPKSAW
jgi:hypothetical protein